MSTPYFLQRPLNNLPDKNSILSSEQTVPVSGRDNTDYIRFNCLPNIYANYGPTDPYGCNLGVWLFSARVPFQGDQQAMLLLGLNCPILPVPHVLWDGAQLI